jgi:hypothetical protein
MSSGMRLLGFAFAVALSMLSRPAGAVEILEETVEQKYTLDAGATLSIANTDGSIRIYGSEGSEIVIQAIKKAYTPERLQGIVVDVKATRGSVTITTAFPPRKNALSDRSGTVDYIVIVPQTIAIKQLDLVNGELLIEGLRGGSATAHVTNGWLAGHNCFANLNLKVETGRLDLAYDWWENHEFSIKAAAARGSIHAFLPGDTSVSISAKTSTGKIANGFAEKKQNGTDVIRSLETVLGTETGASFAMETDDGNIRIDKTY